MPHYVTIKNKKTGRKMGINADVWKEQVERFKGKEMEFEEVQPVTVTIPRKVERVEKKSPGAVVNERLKDIE